MTDYRAMGNRVFYQTDYLHNILTAIRTLVQFSDCLYGKLIPESREVFLPI